MGKKRTAKKREEHPILDYEATGLPTGEEKDERVLEHLIAREDGDPIPYFRASDGRLKYLDKKSTNKETGVITYGFNDLTSKLEREARYAANQLKLTPSLKLFVKVFGPDIGRQIFLDELAKSKVIWDTTDPSLYDIDHMGSKKFLYPHMARNFNPQKSVYNRSEGARELTKEQETALRIVRDNLELTIQLQGPDLTEAQKNQVMERGPGGEATGGSAYVDYDTLLRKTGGKANPLLRATDIVRGVLEGDTSKVVQGVAPVTSSLAELPFLGANEEFKKDLDNVIPKILPKSQPGANTANLSPEFLEASKARSRGAKIPRTPEFGVSEYVGINRAFETKKTYVDLDGINQVNVIMDRSPNSP